MPGRIQKVDPPHSSINLSNIGALESRLLDPPRGSKYPILEVSAPRHTTFKRFWIQKLQILGMLTFWGPSYPGHPLAQRPHILRPSGLKDPKSKVVEP